MTRSVYIYILFLIGLLLGITYIDSIRPKPINWNASFGTHEKSPYGLYVLNEQMTHLFPNSQVTPIEKETLYEFFDQYYDYEEQEYTIKGSFISINYSLQIDENSLDELMTFIGRGNTAFLSASQFPEILQDSLKFGTRYHYVYKDTISCTLADPVSGVLPLKMNKESTPFYFNNFDTLQTKILGYSYPGGEEKVNCIKVPYQKGYFILHLEPFAFTNYYLLKDDFHKYASGILSYVPQNEPVFWFTKYQNGQIEIKSPMKYILKQNALKYAWYTFLIGMVLFLFFNAKRRQRVIPVIEPLQNTTVGFIKTIGNLYFREGNHNTIIEKKIIYFLERIRQTYLLDTEKLDEEFIVKLQHKSGKSPEIIKKAVYLIQKSKKRYKNSEEDLIELNRAIENFWNSDTHNTK